MYLYETNGKVNKKEVFQNEKGKEVYVVKFENKTKLIWFVYKARYDTIGGFCNIYAGKNVHGKIINI
jgi:hypothetical protein